MKPQPQPQRTPSLLLLLLQLDLAGYCAGQLLQAHGPEDEAEIRLCNVSANITSNCVTPHHGLLTALVAALSCLLLLMICSMALPLAAQNRLLRLLACSDCREKPRPGQNFSYIDVGLFKTRNAVCRREVYQQHVLGNGASSGGEGPKQLRPEEQPLVAAGQHAKCVIEVPPAASAASAAAVCTVPICIEPVCEDGRTTAAECSTDAALTSGCGWPELKCQHPAVLCDALFCYRSDPNILQSAATSPSRWPASSDEAQRLLQLQQ